MHYQTVRLLLSVNDADGPRCGMLARAISVPAACAVLITRDG
jgi:hypothetical protein